MSSAEDLSILSYKELQALAVKHRVPGNIKKLLLVKILNALKSGNNLEVSKLITELKKNRKKRTKRLKIGKSEEDNTKALQISKQNSNLFSQSDSYMFPMQHQQQTYPFQWVGAEEEVGGSKYDDIKQCSLSYNDIRQFVFYSTQNAYNNSDTNNNSTLLNEIMDLRTEATVSNYRTVLETSQINHMNQQQSINQEPMADSASRKMSLLLKKMLQAPVGANLGEIASPMLNWSADPNRTREASPDNSETMTAKSDINENDEIWQDSVTDTPIDLPCVFGNDPSYNDNSFYQRTNNTTSFYRSSLDNEPNTLGFDQQQVDNQYQFNLIPPVNPQENCQSWLASNPIGISNNIEYVEPRLDSTVSSSFQSTESTNLINLTSGESGNVHQNGNYYSNNEQLYPHQGSIMLESSEFVPDLQFETNRFYETPNVERPSNSTPNYYNRQLETTPNYIQDSFNTPNHQQNGPNQSSHYSDYTPQLSVPVYHVELENTNHDPGFYQEQIQQQPSIIPQQSVMNTLQQELKYENYAPPATATIAPSLSSAPSNPPPTYNSSVLDAYQPRWSLADQSSVRLRTSGRTLENTLNLCIPNYIDYTKLKETCCVYSNMTPVMTLRKGLNSLSTTHDYRPIGEFRQHNFASNCLLYNDDNETKKSFEVVNTSTMSYGFLTQQSPESII